MARVTIELKDFDKLIQWSNNWWEHVHDLAIHGGYYESSEKRAKEAEKNMAYLDKLVINSNG